jgi:ubiquinone biosynthesis protein
LSRELLFRRIRELIESLSGLWVKAGQLASLRIDLLPMELCRELAKLQNRATGFSIDNVKAILRADLGRPLEDVFEWFDDVPLAAASIGQVHCARLKTEGAHVAVKIQRPNVADVYRRDLQLLRMIAGFIKWVGWMPHGRWHELVWEVELVMIEELDYRYEGAYARRMRRNLARNGILAPKIYRTYTTQRVLIMEFMHGVLMSDYIHYAARDPEGAAAWRKANGVDAEKLAVVLLDGLLQQIFEDNLFHGDLHPGNILVLKGGRCALIDFGTCGFTENAFLDKWRELLRTFGTKDLSRIVDLYFLVCSSSPDIEMGPVRDEIIQRVYEWKRRTDVEGLPFSDKSMDNIAVQIVKILVGSGFELGWSYLRIRRALQSLDASVMELYPTINYPYLSRIHFRAAMERTAVKMARELPTATARAISTTMDMANRIPEVFTMQMDAVRKQIQVLGGDILNIGEMMMSMTRRVAFSAAALFIVYLWRRH